MVKDLLKNIHHSSRIGFYIINPFFRLINFIKYDILSDEKILKKRYRKSFGHELDLKNPKSLNQKINWLKLNDRTDLHTKCADKYEVRSYIANKIGEVYLVPLCFKTDNPKDLTAKNLPDIPCIIKTNHDSGGVVIVNDKRAIDYKAMQNTFRRLLKNNYYQRSKEWQYKNIKPCIIIEKLLQDNDGNIPLDYKLHCFNGKVRMISVDMGRGTANHTRNWYNTEWEREPYSWSSPKAGGKFTNPSNEDIAKPTNLKKMILLSNKLAEPFDYVRVDWYDVEGKLFFGELTFHHDGGTKPILPKEWDFKLGQELILKKHQLL